MMTTLEALERLKVPRRKRTSREIKKL